MFHELYGIRRAHRPLTGRLRGDAERDAVERWSQRIGEVEDARLSMEIKPFNSRYSCIPPPGGGLRGKPGWGSFGQKTRRFSTALELELACA